MPWPKKFEQRSLPLKHSEWLALEKWARELECVADRGPKKGQPSWRTLMKEIANDKIFLIRVLSDTR